MMVTIEIDVPERTVRQYEDSGIDWKARAQKLVQDGLSTVVPLSVVEETPIIKHPELYEWLQERLREAENMTEDEKREAQEYEDELKRNLNANRAENGERLLFV